MATCLVWGFGLFGFQNQAVEDDPTEPVNDVPPIAWAVPQTALAKCDLPNAFEFAGYFVAPLRGGNTEFLGVSPAGGSDQRHVVFGKIDAATGRLCYAFAKTPSNA